MTISELNQLHINNLSAGIKGLLKEVSLPPGYILTLQSMEYENSNENTIITVFSIHYSKEYHIAITENYKDHITTSLSQWCNQVPGTNIQMGFTPVCNEDKIYYKPSSLTIKKEVK